VPVLFAETVELHCEFGTQYANGEICASGCRLHGPKVASTKAASNAAQKSEGREVNIFRITIPSPNRPR
jgi:hypothetical protein